MECQWFINHAQKVSACSIDHAKLVTGQLCNEFEPHYQGITALAWTRDSQALITASKDAQLSVYTLSAYVVEYLPCTPAHQSVAADNSLLDTSSRRPRAYASLKDHHDAITDIAVGYGRFPYCRILTSSSDGTVKVRRRLMSDNIRKTLTPDVTYSFGTLKTLLHHCWPLGSCPLLLTLIS